MASQIDPTKPVDAAPAVKADLRANLQAAKDEIEALQSGKLAAPVANAELADVDEGTIKGRISSDSGKPEDLTPEQARLVLELGALAQRSQVAVPGDLAAAGTPDGTTFLRGDGQWSIAPGAVPEPSITTITGTTHTLDKNNGMHRNVGLLVDNDNQDCTITLPDSSATSSAGVSWAIFSRTTGTVTIQRETNGSINGVTGVQMVGLGRSGMLLVESNAGVAPAARFEGETTEVITLDGTFDRNGKELAGAATISGKDTHTGEVELRDRLVMGAGSSVLSRVQTKSGDYTLAAADGGTIIIFTAAATLTVPSAGALMPGFACEILADGGDVTIDGAGGVDVTLDDGHGASLIEANGKQYVFESAPYTVVG